MFTKQDMLELLTDVLCTMWTNVGGCAHDRKIASDFVHGFYAHLMVPTGENFNKVVWIKKLRETIVMPSSTVNLTYDPGVSMTQALNNNRVFVQTNNEGGKYVILGRRHLPLKEAKDFIDLMVDVVRQVND